jgi:hypothetical protein
VCTKEFSYQPKLEAVNECVQVNIRGDRFYKTPFRPKIFG